MGEGLVIVMATVGGLSTLPQPVSEAEEEAAGQRLGSERGGVIFTCCCGHHEQEPANHVEASLRRSLQPVLHLLHSARGCRVEARSFSPPHPPGRLSQAGSWRAGRRAK